MSILLRCLAALTFTLLILAAGLTANSQTADFSASPLSGCSPLLVTFTDQSSGMVNAYSWNLGNSTVATTQNASTTYTAPGTYTVTLTVTGPGGTDTKTETITVHPDPVISFTATSPTAGCAPHTVQFSSSVTPNAPGNVTYNWDFGDGYSASGASPAHTYVTPGTYTVYMTAINGAGCSKTATRTSYVTAYPQPAVGFGASQTLYCSVPANASFSGSVGGSVGPYSLAWDFGDGGKGGGLAPSHTYAAGGVFSVSVVATDSRGCTDTIAQPNFITVVSTLPTFSGPDSVCVDVLANFANTTPGATNTTWDFDDGTTGSGSAITHVFAASGTYNVEMTTNISGCFKTVKKTVTVNPKPTGSISMSPSIPCPPPVPVTFSGSSSLATRYQWKWLSGGTDTGQTVIKNYVRPFRTNPDGNDEVTMIMTTAAGCQDSVFSDTVMLREIYVDIHPTSDFLPEAYDRIARGCVPLTITFDVTLHSSLPPVVPVPVLYPLQAISWDWDFGDGSPPDNTATPMHTYTSTGDFRVRCAITTPNGCVDTGYRWVHVDTPVHPSFSASPLIACPKDPITFVNTSTVLADTRFFLKIDEDTIISRKDTSRIVVGIKKPGTYTVVLYSDHRGCMDSLTRRDYIVVRPPGAMFYDSVYCNPPTVVKFTEATINASSLLWDFGDGTTSTARNPIHSFPDTGAYVVTLIAYNSTYGCTDTFRRSYQLFKPFIDFAGDDSAICTNDTVILQAAFAGSGDVRYAWKIGQVLLPYDDTSAALYRFPTRGRYDVTLYTNSGNGCIDSLTKPNYVLVSRPAVAFDMSPPIGCKPLTIGFSDQSTNTRGIRDTFRYWTFGDGDMAFASNALQTISHHYPNVGTYAVTLMVVDSLNCRDSLTQYISVHQPQAVFTLSDDSVCARAPITFRSQSSAAALPIRHQWDFGDQTSDTGYVSVHRYAAPGVYSARLIVTDTVGCADTFYRHNIFVESPQASFRMSDSLAICPPLQVRFTNLSAQAASYRWDFGTGSTPVVVANPVATFSNPGLYTVTLVATNINGCTDTARDTVRVLGYSGAFSYTPLTGCAPLAVGFSTALNGIPRITWDFGDGTTSTSGATSATHTYTVPGAYLPKVIFSDGGTCSSPSIGLDTIRVDRIDADFSWSVPCVGSAFTLKDSSTALYSGPVSWTWIFGAGDTATGTPISRTYTTPGNHPVTLIAANAAGCRDTIMRNVFINPLPAIRVTDDTGVCPGDAAPLVAAGGVRYTWSPAPDSLHNCPIACDTAFVHIDNDTPGVSAIYIVTGTDANGCVNKDSVRVFIQLKTTSTTGDGGEICVGQSFRLHAEGAHRYEWMPAATIDSPFIASPLATPERTTIYIVAAREGTCLVDSQRVVVIVRSLPLFNAGPDQTIAAGSAATLLPTQQGISRIVWRPDTTLSCHDCFRPNVNPLYTTTYYATGYNEWGCEASDSVTVHVRCNGSLVFIPNAFTPNGDGQNDYFFPRGRGIDVMSTFRVYNRWGEIVFERSNALINDERSGWDGTFRGRALPPDVYVYTMQSTCPTGEILQWKGDVAIMR